MKWRTKHRSYFERKIHFPLEIFAQKNPYILAFSTDFRIKWHIFAFALVTCFQVVFLFPNIFSHDHWNSLMLSTVVICMKLPEWVSQRSLASLITVFPSYKEGIWTYYNFTELKWHRREILILSNALFMYEHWALSVNYCFPLVTVLGRVQVQGAEMECHWLSEWCDHCISWWRLLPLFHLYKCSQTLENISKSLKRDFE